MRVLSKLDITKIQYMNMFERVTRVKADNCFDYNNIIIFTVPRNLIRKSVGRNIANIKVLVSRLNKKVKIIASPTGNSNKDIENFLKSIISPYMLKNSLVESHKLTIYSAPRAKAMLIGRNKQKLKQLSDILKRFFRIEQVIIR